MIGISTMLSGLSWQGPEMLLWILEFKTHASIKTSDHKYDHINEHKYLHYYLIKVNMN